MNSRFNKLLREVERPSRYIGDEFGLPAVDEDQDAVRLRLAIGFPDTYEVGMSHLGFRLLHAGLLDLQPEGILTERVFLPYEDMQRLLRREGMALRTLERQTPLAELDLLGLSVQYELAYPAVLKMLDLGGIPRRAADRQAEGEPWPLVLVGGSVALNPEPLAPFADLVFLGEADNALPEIARALADLGPEASREQKLRRLSEVDGIYVPEWVEVEHRPDSLELEIALAEGAPADHLPVHRRVVADLDSLPIPDLNLVPSCSPVHDRVVVEIQRGCSQGCRFCQAGYVTRPTRQRGEKTVLDEARRLLDQTGYQDLALLSLSAGDHPRLLPMLSALIKEHGPRNVAVSLPSLRTETLDSDVAAEISKVRQTSFTLAPEAATDRLRRVINKQNTDLDLMAAVEAVFKAGYGRLKLYFMIGLPTETDEDLLAIASLADRVHRQAKKIRPQATIAVSVSNFVPKPHTAFQWEAAPSREEIDRKLTLLREAMPRRVRPFRWHHGAQSVVEAILARGDRRLAGVLERVVDEEHTGLDAWTEHFSRERWDAALEAAHAAGEIPAPDLYLEARPPGAALPWDHLRFGVERAYLASEARAALDGETRPDCTDGDCDHCGVCPDEPEHVLAVAPPPAPEAAPQDAVEPAPETPPGGAQKVRLWFRKRGRAALIGHLEMMVIFERAARRAGAPLHFSQGYHPKPKIRFSPALPLGAESRCEFMEITLRQVLDLERLQRELAAQLPPGLDLERIEEASDPVLNRIRGLSWLLTPEPALGDEELEQARQRLEAGPIVFYRGRKRKPKDLAKIVTGVERQPEGGGILVTCNFGQHGTVKPEEILRHLLGVQDEDLHRCGVVRMSWDLEELPGNKP